MNRLKLIRLIIAFLLLAFSAVLIFSAVGKKYTAFAKPAEEDGFAVSADTAHELPHFELVEQASFDGITRYPNIGSANVPEDVKWVLVIKNRAAACVS
ncbi:MAG: hypothetical protein Kow00107_06740 [Planctomycetota bacterium]